MAPASDSRQSHLSPGETTISVKELEASVGLSSRTLQFWTLMDVLKTSNDTFSPGRGKSRRFPLQELAVARALRPAYTLGLPTKQLAGVAAAVRDLLERIGNPPNALGDGQRLRLLYQPETGRWSAEIAGNVGQRAENAEEIVVSFKP